MGLYYLFTERWGFAYFLGRILTTTLNTQKCFGLVDYTKIAIQSYIFRENLYNNFIGINYEEILGVKEDALLASFFCGVAWSTILLSPLGVPVVNLFIPKAAQDILHLALSYSRIRAFGFIFALASLVLRSCFLA